MTPDGYIEATIKVDNNDGKSPKEKLRRQLSPVINSTPQQLMDLPYAGQASTQCEQDGNWDEDAGKKYKEWTVDLEGYDKAALKVTVKARSEDEAYEEADDLGKGEFDIYNEGDCYNAKEAT